MKGKRKERERQFLEAGWPGISFSQDAIGSCDLLLRAALADRKRKVWREPKNHFTSHAPAVVSLAVGAFDTWVTEHAFRRQVFDHESARRISLKPLIDRVELLGAQTHSGESQTLGDLRQLIDLRDEIVHWLPRAAGEPPHIPLWFKTLDEQGLLIRTGRQADFHWVQKLSSYRLAYHVCHLIDRLVVGLVDSAPEDAFVPDAGASNFKFYQALPGPLELLAFDQANGITEYSEARN